MITLIKRVYFDDNNLIEECNYLLKKLIIEDSKYDDNFKIDLELNSLKDDLNDSNNYIYVFIEDNIVVGFIYGQINDSKRYKEKVGKILFLYVLDEYRNKKIASKLINEIKNIFLSNNVRYLNVNVFNNNKIAYDLYKKNGFDNYVSNLKCKLK